MKKDKRSSKEKKQIVKMLKEVPKGPKCSECGGDKYFHTEPKTELEKFLHSMIPEVAETFGLGKVNYFFNTIKNDSDVAKMGLAEEGDGELIMAINYREAYKSAYINICPSATRIWEDGDKKLIRHAFVHEVAHVVTNRLADVARMRSATNKEIRDAVENTTESVAMIARELLSKKYPKVFIF